MNLPLNIDFRQILLHMFNFVILIGGLYILLYKPVKDYMDNRLNTYKQMDEEANQKLNDANALQDKINKQIADVDKDLSKAKLEAHKQIEEEKANIIKKAKEEANQIIEDAKEKANNEKAKIVASSSSDIEELVSKTVKEMLAKDSYEEFLNNVDKDKANA